MDELEQFLSKEASLSVSDRGMAFLGMKTAAFATESELKEGASPEAPAKAQPKAPAADAAAPEEEAAAPAFPPMAAELARRAWNAAENIELAHKAIEVSCRAKGEERPYIQGTWLVSDVARSLSHWVILSGLEPQLKIELPPTDLGGVEGAAWIQAMMDDLILTLQSLFVALEGTPRTHSVSHWIKRIQESVDEAKAKGPDAMNDGPSACGSKLAAQAPAPEEGDVIVPEPGAESHEASVIRDQQLALQQAQAEKAYMTSQAQAAATRAADAEAQAEELQGQLEEASQQAEMSGQEALQATEAAAQATEQATAQSVAKMNLGMRMQQFRQELAGIVAQDPVAEEALSFGELAGAGAPVTQAQQGQAEEEEMLAQGIDPEAGGEAGEEAEQAQRAQSEADQQKQQAAEKTSGRRYFR